MIYSTQYAMKYKYFIYLIQINRHKNKTNKCIKLK